MEASEGSEAGDIADKYSSVGQWCGEGGKEASKMIAEMASLTSGDLVFRSD